MACDWRGSPRQSHSLGGVMGLSPTEWTALGAIFTAIAAFVALGVGIVPYRQQNRLARATALRGLVRTILHDSQDIYDLTVYASSVIPDAQIRAFRRQLGETVTADDFRRYFFTDCAILAPTSFIGASLDSPAYSRLSALWNDIDWTSAELRGSLRILYDAAALIISDSQEICFPDTSIDIAIEMAKDGHLRDKCEKIDNIDALVLILSQELSRRMHIGQYESKLKRLDDGRSFVESLASTIRDIKDRSLRGLASESFSDWPECLTPELLPHGQTPAIGRAHGKALADDSEKRNLDDIDKLMKQVKRKIPVKAASDLEERFIKWRRAYAK